MLCQGGLLVLYSVPCRVFFASSVISIFSDIFIGPSLECVVFVGLPFSSVSFVVFSGG